MTKIFVLVFVTMTMGACVSNDDSTAQVNTVAQYGKKRDAAVPPADAPAPGTAGWASCFTSGNPLAACHLTVNFCCFDNFMAGNNGYCTTSCPKSDEHCDGPEDCASGESCFASLWNDDANHWSMACASSAPTTHGIYPVTITETMCHSNAQCPPAKPTCTPSDTAGVYDFAANLSVCR